jgi:hypothetical protein
MTLRTKPKPCPFCGKTPEVFPRDPKQEGNAWAAVQCMNHRCATYAGLGNGGVQVRDGALQCDERGSDAYKAAAIRRWNKRA